MGTLHKELWTPMTISRSKYLRQICRGN